jgi:hypothetical protein
MARTSRLGGCLLVTTRRLVQLALFSEGIPKVVVGLREVRPEAQGLLKGGHRLARLPLPRQGNTPAIVRLGGVRLDGWGLATASRRLLPRPFTLGPCGISCASRITASSPSSRPLLTVIASKQQQKQNYNNDRLRHSQGLVVPSGSFRPS